MMKTALLVSMVVGAHVVIIGGIMLTQGCGVSPRAQLDPGMPGEPIMPPLSTAVTTVETVEVAPPVNVVVAPKPVIDLPEETSTYVVGKGESLSVIAREHGVRVADIVALNSIKNPNKVRAGQKLLLPGKDTAGIKKKVSVKSKKKMVAIPEGATSYIVKKGDSLSVIAYKARVNISDLKAANGISGNKIFINQKLIIPSGKSISESIEMPVITKKIEKVDIVEDNAKVVEKTTTITVDEPELDNDVILAAPVKNVDNDLEVREYVVEDDDDLYGVAMMWGVSIARLKEINKLSDTKLSVGQKILIPVSE